MKTEDELNQEIQVTRLKIREYSPKFVHSLGDGPDPTPNLESKMAYNMFLDSYLITLKKVLKKYEENH